MKITILGSGAAGGVPMISVGWGRCDPNEPKNNRLRPSILIEDQGQTILVDSGPDLREQLLRANVHRLDAVLFTHAHADHVHGIDDLREVNRAMKAPIDAFGSARTMTEIDGRFGYVFTDLDITTMPIYKPWLIRHDIETSLKVGPIDITAFDLDHGYTRSTGYRIGKFAYTTDVWEIPETSFQQLYGLDLWIVGCLLDRPHTTHAHVDKVLAWVERLKPARTLLTHMSPKLDYQTLRQTLPSGVEPAYDGMTIALD